MLALGLAVAAVGACGPHRAREAAMLTGGDLARGAALIGDYGCGTCHTVPGIRGANGLVGPPLAGIARRMYIAGVLENNPANMVRWIRDPQSVDDKTAMPTLGLSETDAVDVAAYLYTLR